MLQLKGKLKRLNAGMSRDTFDAWVRGNAVKHRMFYGEGDVRTMIATVYRVKPEFETEIVSYIQMLCDETAITPRLNATVSSWKMFDLTVLRLYTYQTHRTLTLAIQTDKGWLVVLPHIRVVNRFLSKRR